MPWVRRVLHKCSARRESVGLTGPKDGFPPLPWRARLHGVVVMIAMMMTTATKMLMVVVVVAAATVTYIHARYTHTCIYNARGAHAPKTVTVAPNGVTKMSFV